MGVRADHTLSGGGQSLFRQKGVLHPHAAHIIKMGDLILLCKFPYLCTELSRLDVLTGGVMIQHQSDLFPVEHPGQTRLIEF